MHLTACLTVTSDARSISSSPSLTYYTTNVCMIGHSQWASFWRRYTQHKATKFIGLALCVYLGVFLPCFIKVVGTLGTTPLILCIYMCMSHFSSPFLLTCGDIDRVIRIRLTQVIEVSRTACRSCGLPGDHPCPRHLWL